MKRCETDKIFVADYDGGINLVIVNETGVATSPMLLFWKHRSHSEHKKNTLEWIAEPSSYMGHTKDDLVISCLTKCGVSGEHSSSF